MPQQPFLSALPGYKLPDSARIMQTRHALKALLKREYLLPALLITFSSLVGLVIPWCLAIVVDDGILAGNFQILFTWLTVAAAAQVLSGFFRYFSVCRITSLSLNVEKNRMTDLFSKTMSADLRALPDIAQGQCMGQIIFASSSERHFIELACTQGTALIITGIGTFSALFLLSWQLACLSLLIFPVAALLWIWMKKKIGPAVRNEYEKRESVYRRIVDAFRAMISIRALQQGPKFTSKFEHSCEEVCCAGCDLNQKLAVQGPFFDSFQAFMILAVFGAGGYGVIHNFISVGALIGFQLYLTKLFGLLRGGTGIFGAWQQYVEGRARLLISKIFRRLN